MSNDLIALYGGAPVRKEKIFYAKQHIDSDDIAAVDEVLKSSWLTQGPQTTLLENKLCNLFEADYAVVCTNGTSALHLACIAAGIGEGDEVITTPLTFAASANCVRYCGGTVVFADILSDTFNIDPESVAKKITDRTKAVIAVDYAGQPAKLNELKELCDLNNIVLIEDAAHSLGSMYNGKAVGGLSDLTTFSFHAVKAITGGEGGAVLTNNKSYSDKMRLAANHGITKNAQNFKLEDYSSWPWYCEQIMLGFNYRMTEMQAALINSQSMKLNQFKKRRKQIYTTYNEAFSNMPGIILPFENSDLDVNWHLYVIRVDETLAGFSRSELCVALSAENIQPQVHYVPVHLHPYYRSLGHYEGECPIAEKVYSQIISLPLYPSMEDEDVGDVVNAMKKIYEFYRKRNKKI